MGKCKECGKSGLFLKLKNGLCESCFKNNNTSAISFISEEEYTNNLKNLNLIGYIPNQNDYKALTSQEELFLSSIKNQSCENIIIPRYWYFDFYFDYSSAIKKYIAQELIVIREKSLSDLKIPELKEILRDNAAPVSGNKEALIERINSLDIDVRKAIDAKNNHYYSLTDKGISIIENIKYTATHDADFEDMCIQLLLNNNLYDFYNEAINWMSKKPKYSEMNLFKENAKSIDKNTNAFYERILYSNDYEKIINCCLVFGVFLNLDSSVMQSFMTRLFNEPKVYLLIAVKYYELLSSRPKDILTKCFWFTV